MATRQSLLEKASRRWEIDRQLLQSMRHDEEAHHVAGPVIAISRELGSGGTSTGKMLANQLGFKYYDRELIEEIAAQANTDPERIMRHETSSRSSVGSMLLSFMDRRNVQDTVYLRSLVRVLRGIAKEGRAVIIGRGGPCVLTNALRVRFIAPFEVRVERTAQVYGLTPEEARRRLLEGDHAQRRFLRAFFGCDPDDVHLYDLVINTGNLSLEHAAELVITRLRQTWHEKEGK